MKRWGILGFKNFILANLDDNYCLLSSHIEEWIITCDYCNQGWSILPNNSVWWWSLGWWSNASHAWSCVHALYYWRQAPPIQKRCYDCWLEESSTNRRWLLGTAKFQKVAGHFRQLATVDQFQTALLKNWKESLPSIILSLIKLLFQPIIARCCWPLWVPNSGILGQCLVMLS